MLVQGFDATQAYQPFQGREVKFLPYRDAGKGPSLYELHVIDVLRGVHKARQLGWVDFKSFDIKTYEHYEKVENGDWNWIIPGKFLAFATPKGQPTKSYELSPCMLVLPLCPPPSDMIADFVCSNSLPAYYVEHFKKIGVTTVVRLNEKLYDERDFTNYGQYLEASPFFFFLRPSLSLKSHFCFPSPLAKKASATMTCRTLMVTTHQIIS